jgi:hypothetical protein
MQLIWFSLSKIIEFVLNESEKIQGIFENGNMSNSTSMFEIYIYM